MTVPADRIINNNDDVARQYGTAALADSAVTADKLADGAVEAGDIADNSVTTAKIADLNVTQGKIALLAIDTPQLAAAGVTFAKAAVFVSTEQTGTGSPQNIAHGLGATPAAVLVVPTATAPATAGDYTATEGAHDATNVVVTVTSSKKYKVMAWA